MTQPKGQAIKKYTSNWIEFDMIVLTLRRLFCILIMSSSSESSGPATSSPSSSWLGVAPILL